MSLTLIRQQSKENRAARVAEAAASGSGSGGPCPCLVAARAWLASSANTLRLKLVKSDSDEWTISCPSLASSSSSAAGVCFGLTLPLPHGLSVQEEGSVLEELEAESYSFLFGEDEASIKKRASCEASAAAAIASASATTSPTAAAAAATTAATLARPSSASMDCSSSSSDALPPLSSSSSSAAAPAKHEGCTAAAVLAFAHQFIKTMDSGWRDDDDDSSHAPRHAAKKSTGGDDEEEDDDGAASDASMASRKSGKAGADPFGEDGEDGGGGGGGGGDDDDEDGFGQDDDDGGTWGDAEEVDVLESGVDASAKTMAAAPSPANTRLAASSAASASSSSSTAAGGDSAATSSSSAASSSASSSQAVAILSRADVAEMQASMISRVASTLGVTSSAAIMLLRLVKWDEQACFDRWKKEGAAEYAKAACATACLREYMAQPVFDAKSGKDGSGHFFECPCCYDDEVPYDRTFAMRCGHRLCMPCYLGYVTSELTTGSLSGGSALGMKCAGEKCKEVLGQECVEMILMSHHETPEDEKNHSKLLERYENLLVLSFVDDNDTLQWCPAPNCGRVIRSFAKLSTVKCACGFQCCFRCKLEAHAPCTCTEASTWLMRDKAEANLDTKYLLEQTKACPKCHVRTKKEGGCMWMACSQCKTSWCWHCGQDGADHHVWECNRPQYEGVDKGSELNRYLFYYERYFNHRESTKIASKQMVLVEEKMTKLVAEGLMHFMQVEFLKSATQLVFQCRRVLSWSYAHAFYITDKSNKTLFEFRQSELEQYTEKLNALTEGSLEQLSANRLLVLDWTRALTRFMQNMEIDEVSVERSIPAHAHTSKPAPGTALAVAAAAVAAAAKEAAAAAAAADKTAAAKKTKVGY